VVHQKKRLMLAFLLLTCLGLALTVPGTIAYITARTAPLVNVFTVGQLPEGEVEVPIQITKTVTSVRKETIPPSGFVFELTNEEGTESLQCTSDGLGNAALNLSFGWEDAGKTHVFALYEVNNGIAHVTYSPLVYRIEIDVFETEDHTLDAALRLNGSPVDSLVAAFENIYGEDLPPDTGDHAMPLMYAALAMISVLGLAVLLGRKKQEN